MGNGELDKNNFREAILQYLHNNPNAADSLDGIVSWWLPSTYKKVDASKIEQVLRQLVSEGLVIKSFLVDGTILYRQGKPGS